MERVVVWRSVRTRSSCAARIESDELAPYYAFGGKDAMHPKVAMAWTQPYQRS